MAVERVGYFQKYIGLSSDEKPSFNEDVAISILPGAEFHEIDTNDIYIWDGTEWKWRNSLIARYAYRSENTDAPPAKVTYVGEALPGSDPADSVWRIRKITETAHVGFDDDIEITWCNGSDSFSNPWNGHAGFSYS